MDSLAKKLNITDPEAWYSISSRTFIQHGGSGLLQKYDGSLRLLFTTVYPEYQKRSVDLKHKQEDLCRTKFCINLLVCVSNQHVDVVIHKWAQQKFARAPSGYWDNLSIQRSFLQEVAKKLHITTHDDLRRFTTTAIQQSGGSGLVPKYRSLSELLVTVYPEYRDVCRSACLRIVNELHLEKAEDLQSVSVEYRFALIFAYETVIFMHANLN